MSFEKFKEDLAKSNKSDLERKMYEGKNQNILAKRIKIWLAAFEKLKKLASLLNYEIHFIKIKKSKKDGKG
jgi:hypothetical protein